jgi:integrase
MAKKQQGLLIDEPPPSHLVGQRFVYATGLRYSELGRLRAKDIHQEPDGQVWLEVAGWSDTPTRKVPVLAGYEAEVLALTTNPYVFGNFQLYPTHFGMQSLRRAYARQLYQQCVKKSETGPAPDGEGLVNETALGEVMAALGHQRREVVLRDYLRIKEAVSDNDPEEEVV